MAVGRWLMSGVERGRGWLKVPRDEFDQTKCKLIYPVHKISTNQNSSTEITSSNKKAGNPDHPSSKTKPKKKKWNLDLKKWGWNRSQYLDYILILMCNQTSTEVTTFQLFLPVQCLTAVNKFLIGTFKGLTALALGWQGQIWSRIIPKSSSLASKPSKIEQNY